MVLVFLTRHSNRSKGGQSKWVKYQHLITIIFSTLFTLIVYTLFFLLDKQSNDRKNKPYNKTKVQGRAFDLYLLLSEFFLYIHHTSMRFLQNEKRKPHLKSTQQQEQKVHLSRLFWHYYCSVSTLSTQTRNTTHTHTHVKKGRLLRFFLLLFQQFKYTCWFHFIL